MVLHKKVVIGQAEKIGFPDMFSHVIPARIDTGAKTSSVWASKVWIENDVLHAELFGGEYPKVVCKFRHFTETVVSSSNGQSQSRYKVKLRVILHGRKIRASFTLADRSTQVYPVLVGRNILRGKFIVDVTQGEPLKRHEKVRSANLKSQLQQEGK